MRRTLFSVCVLLPLLASAFSWEQGAQAPTENYALAFDGVDDYVEIAHRADVNFGRLEDAYTVEAWVYLPAGARSFIIAAKGQYGWGDEQPFTLEIDARLCPGFGVGDAAVWQNAGLFSPDAISTGEWHHIAGVRDTNTDTIRLYVDGVLKGEVLDDMEAEFTRETPIYIGRNLGGGFGRAIVDELRISNIARYTDNFAVPRAPFIPDEHTVRLWHFDTGEGDTTFDSTVADEGKISGATWVTGYPFPETVSYDRKPPVLANPQPTGVLPPYSNLAPISIDTDESAKCRHARRAEAPYSQMIPFDSVFTTHHEATAYDLHDGNAYTLYVRCVDRAGNLTPTPGVISFEIDIVVDRTPVEFSSVQTNADTVGLYNKFEVSFKINKTYPNPYQPYSTEFGPYGVSVDGLFSPDHWQTTITQPGFYYEAFERVADFDWTSSLYPTGEVMWKVRFAPTALGDWEYKIRVTDASGAYYYPEDGALTFDVAPSDNPGFVHVSPTDNRYFEFSNGETFFPFGFTVGAKTFETLNHDLAQIGEDGANFFRWWLSGTDIHGSSTTPWQITDVPFDGHMGPTGLSAAAAWGDGLFSVKLDTENVQCLSQKVPVRLNTTYVLSARVKLVDVGNPIDDNYPYGFMFREAGWAEPHRCLQPGEGRPLSQDPVAASGTHDWMVVTERFNSGDRRTLSVKLNLQNVREGVVYIDSVSLREDLGDGQLGPEVLSRPDFDFQNYFSQRPSWFLDYALEQAEAFGLYYKFVIFEKRDWLYRHMNRFGRAQLKDDQTLGVFHSAPGAPVRRMHENYLRYLTARWGYSTSVHSWEAVNENHPGDPGHLTFVNDLAAYIKEVDPNQHLVTTSFWCCGIGDRFDLWNDPRFPNIDYGDVHLYITYGEWGHGPWVNTPETYFDTANFVKAHTDLIRAQDYHFPFVAGEVGLMDDVEEQDALALDTEGVWLHNLLWAWLYDGRLSLIYWFDDNIFRHGLPDVYRPIRAFLDGVPLSSGFYQHAEAQVSNPNLRAWGQKDTQHGGLHLWVQNTAHTWKNVVDGVDIPPESGVITVGGFAPNQTLSVETWDTYTGQIVATTPTTTNAAGDLALAVQDLRTDQAFRVMPQYP